MASELEAFDVSEERRKIQIYLRDKESLNTSSSMFVSDRLGKLDQDKVNLSNFEDDLFLEGKMITSEVYQEISRIVDYFEKAYCISLENKLYPDLYKNVECGYKSDMSRNMLWSKVIIQRVMQYLSHLEDQIDSNLGILNQDIGELDDGD